MSDTDTAAPPATEGDDKSVEQLLAEVAELTEQITTQEKATAELIRKRLTSYYRLRELQVPFARIDEASGNRPGAARAAIFKDRNQRTAPQSDTPPA